MTDLRRSRAGAWIVALVLCCTVVVIGLMFQIANGLPPGTTGNCGTRCMEEAADEELTAGRWRIAMAIAAAGAVICVIGLARARARR